MASPSSTRFERSLNQFRDYLSNDQKQQFNAANSQDLNGAIQQIQAKLGRDKSLCNFRRIEKFLNGMKHVEQLVTIFLNVHEVVAFVWGPIKLALMAATVWTDSIRQLLDAYEEIGEALTNLAFFHTLIKSQGAEHLKEALEDYFSDILRFHRCVLDVFSRPNWKTFFKAAWGGFRRQVEPIIRALKLRQEKLSHERLQSHAIHEGVRDFREHTDGRFDKIATDLDNIRSTLESERLRQQTSAHDQDMKDLLEDKLDISRSGSRIRLDSPELSSSSAGDWIFQHPDFQSWEEGSSSQGNVLFLNGSPGAGKTTLATKVIRHLKNRGPNHGSPVYFFFRHDDELRKSAKGMLRTLLSQLIQRDETILRYLYDKFATMGSNIELSNVTTLQDLAQDCLTSQRSACVVLDGIDECSENEPERIITWLLDKVLPSATSRGCRLQLLVCGQRDGRLDQLLSGQPQIRLDTVHSHQKDIEEYSKSRAAEICARFSQTAEQEEKLASKVAKTSQGMFLYTKVVMSNFLAMDSIDEFEDEVENDTFPEDLDQAYERIVQRVLERAKPSRQKTVKKILGWIICSKRPLRWREIQSRFCIDAESGSCNPKRQRLDTCKDICSSLVDITNCDLFGNVQSEQIVHMVHDTASKYLVRKEVIDLLQEHADMALFCCRYLSSQPFLQHVGSDNLQHALRSGYFGFLDYAIAHYSYHIQERRKHGGGLPADIVSSVEALCAACSNDASIPCMETCALEATNTLFIENINSSIQARAIAIRTVIESQHHELSRADKYLDLSGPMRFKCPKVGCSKFTTGFQDQDVRNKHLDRHQRPYICTYTDCFLHDLGCESRERLEAHCKVFHQETPSLAVTFPTVKRAKAKDIIDACQKGNIEEVKRFHLAGAELSKSGTGSYVTPLYVATRAGHVHICKYLVEQGINPFHSWTYRARTWSPMLEAIRQSRTSIIELFMHTNPSHQCSASMSQFSRCISMAILSGHSEALELLLETDNSLDHAVMVEQVVKDLMGLTLGEKKEPSADSTLVHAWFRRALPNLYLERSSALDGKSLIKSPDSTEYRTCKRRLLQSDARFLHDSLQTRCHPLSMFLLDLSEEDDLQLTNNRGLLPIHILSGWTCRNLDCEKCPIIMQRVIQIGGTMAVNIRGRDIDLPIHIALKEPDIPTGLLQALLSHTNDLDFKDLDSISPIHLVYTQPRKMSMLLATGRVNLFTRNSQGQTVFSSAAESTSTDVKILEMLHQAQPALAWASDETQDRKTPLHYIMWYAGTSAFSLQKKKAEFLLSLTTVEHVLRAFLTSSANHNALACKNVREFARDQGLEAAIEVMDRIGFGL